MSDKNFDNMSDEEFMEMLEEPDEEFGGNDEAYDSNEDTEHQEINEQDEDTDDSSFTETNEYDDDNIQDTDNDESDDDSDDDFNEDAENSQNEEDDDEESSNKESDEEDSKNANDDNQAEDKKDEKEAEPFDYEKALKQAQEEAEEYKKFYNDVTSEFVANGKKMKGFTDPKKIKQAQQMAAGFSDKMRAFKQYRPFIKPLEEKGIIENPDKFNLMLNALDGDKEAIKKIIQDADIDPIELDMDNIDYKSNNHVSSNIELAFEDVVDNAAQYGVREQVEKVISDDWDDNSVIELLENPENSSDLVSHLSTGVYDLVQEKIAEKKMTDPLGVFSSKRAIDQYREAAQEVEADYKDYIMQEQARLAEQGVSFDNNGYPIEGSSNQSQPFTEEEIQAEILRIKNEQEYASKVEKRNAEADKGRRKAASVSKRKPRSKKKVAPSFDPGKMSDDEFTDYLDNLIASED